MYIQFLLTSMNESDFLFDIQERIASYSDSMRTEDYWYFYNDFAKGIQKQLINPVSIIIMNINLLKKVKQSELILYERPTCIVELSILETYKSIRTESEMITISKSLLEMVNEYINVFWLSSSLLKVLVDIVSAIVQKTNNHNGEIEQVGLLILLYFRHVKR